MHHPPSRWKYLLLALSLAALVSLVACGQSSIVISGNSAHAPESNIPVGTGNNPEPGTNGQPQPQPHGHGDSIIAWGSVAYVGSDNGRLYALEAGNGKVEWQRSLGAAVYVFAVTSGVVYVTADSSSSSVLSAVDAATGKVRWQYKPGTSITKVIVSNAMVIAGTSSSGDTMTIYGLRAATGTPLWHFAMSTSLPGLLGALNGVVYLNQLSGLPPNPTTSTLYALDDATGKVLWQASIPGSDGMVAGVPVASNGILYVETGYGGVCALQAATGAVVWHISGSQVIGVPPTVLAPDSPLGASGVVYVGGPEGITAYRAGDGSIIWHFPKSLAGPTLPQLVLVSGVIYIDGFLLEGALNAATGTVVWQNRNGFGGSPLSGPPLVSNGLIISNDPTVDAVRTSDGTTAWKSPVSPGGGGNVNAGKQESIADGVVYIGTDDGMVHPIGASNGGCSGRMPYGAGSTYATSL